MGIRIVEAAQLLNVFKSIRKNMLIDNTQPIKVCSLGYPDLLFSSSEFTNQFNTQIPDSIILSLKNVKYNSDLSRSRAEESKSFVDPESFFQSLGASLDVIDVKKHRGTEILIDLNIANSTACLASKYDLVIDNGTLEHCFNIGEALINTARLAKNNGGYVFHINPILMVNHGFFNLCPTFLHDFYDQNKFHICSIIATGVKTQKSFKIDPTKRYSLSQLYSQEEIIMNCLVQSQLREDHANWRNFVYPVQSKYKIII